MRAFASLLLLIPYLDARPLRPRRTVVHERRDGVPDGFVRVGAPPASQTLVLHLGLTQGDMMGLAERLAAVSAPMGAEYGQFLTKGEVEAFVAPKKDTVDAVNAFFAEHGIAATPITPAGDRVSISVSVSKANEVFRTQFETFVDVASKVESVRALEYSVPVDLQEHIAFVQPTTMFPSRISRPPSSAGHMVPVRDANMAGNLSVMAGPIPSSCGAAITPGCLQELYSIPTKPATQSTNVLALSGLGNQVPSETDLKEFLMAYRSDVDPLTTYSITNVNGSRNSQSPGNVTVQANLDVQYAVGIATGVPVQYLSAAQDAQDDVLDLLAVANFLLSQERPPHVYASSSSFDERLISPSVATNLCNAYMQLGARGTSVIFSSGNRGTSGAPSDGNTCSDSFVRTFPSGCPFVTSVGATTGVPETPDPSSSGGFSNIFARPAYQTDAVTAYLSSSPGNADAGRFNTSGRGYPDVAAQGGAAEFVFQGNEMVAKSMSFSGSVFASVVALLNDELVAAGKAPLGFLNPLLYTIGASALNDISASGQSGCGGSSLPSDKGWDPVTGLGTPNYAALHAAVGL